MLRVVPVNPADPPAPRVDAAVEALGRGEVIALPTETFYGLAADAFQSPALVRVNLLKDRTEAAPILLLLADAAQVAQVSDDLPDRFVGLVEMFWPGPLTLVVPAAARVPRQVTAGAGTVAVRVPGLALPRRIAARLGRPITGPSANLHGRRPCRTALEVAETFPSGVSMVLDGGPSPGGAASTILDLTGARPRIVREGLVPTAALRPFVPELE